MVRSARLSDGNRSERLVAMAHSRTAPRRTKPMAHCRACQHLMQAGFLVAQMGARMHYAVPRILHREGRLTRLYTDICAAKGWPALLRWLPRNWLPAGARRLSARVPQEIPPSRITALTPFGFEYARRRRAAKSASEATATHLWAGETFCRQILLETDMSSRRTRPG